tara:strand:+ start:613 stop:2301 length:1689 start_codon:yes stop_codon:yes gene_type:complete
MNVNSLLEGASPLKSQQKESAKLVSKWEKSGLLEGLGNHESEKPSMAVLLENQARQLVKEASSLGTAASVTTGDSEAYAGVALPLVRRVFGEIVAKDLLSVQPLNLPSGLIFYLDFQYGSSASSRFDQNESLYGATEDLTRTQLPDATTTDQGLYGAGRFGYSINETSSFNTCTSASATFTGILALDTEFSSSKAGEFGGATGATSVVRTLSVTNAFGTSAVLTDADPEGVRAFNVSNPGVVIFPQFTRVNGDNLEFVISASAGAGALLTGSQIDFQKGPDNLDDRGDFQDTIPASSVSSLAIPEINVQLRSSTVTAKTRKLKAQWTPEFAQDLNAYHSIDAEAELTSILSEYISMEIDLELLDMLITNADTVEGWSAKIAQDVVVSSNSTSGGTSNPTFTSSQNNLGVYYTKMSWFQTLGVKLQKVSNLIHQKTLRGGANFLVCSPTVSTVLESIPGFAADSAGDANKYAMGVQKIGAINSRYTVYKNPYMTENVILMGYKGNQFLETGAVFAPYIPLIMTPLVYDPVSFSPRKGIMTRYAKKMVRPDFYGKVVCQDLNQV